MADEEKREQQKRQIAIKVRIDNVLSGRYIQEEGWTPNYIESSGKKISRANIIGVVLEKDDEEGANFNSIILEDGSGQISARVFGDDLAKLNGINVGDVVLIIARPREYGTERYLLLEIIKKIENKKWIEVRKIELENNPVVKGQEKKQEVKEDVPVEENIGEELGLGDKIIEFIRTEDKGEGVEIEEVVKKFGDDTEIKTLLSEGELFEVKPGRVKVLE